MATYSPEQWARIQAITKTMDRTLAKAFLDSINRLRDRDINWDDVEQYLDDHRPDLVMAAISDKLIQNGFAGFAQAMTDAYLMGGKLAAEVSPPIFSAENNVRVAVTFNAANPTLTDTMNQYTMRKIAQITDNTRTAIQNILKETVQNGVNPREAARQIKELIGLTENQVKMVKTYRAILEDESKIAGALNRALRDRRFDSSVNGVLSGRASLSAEKIDKMVAQYESKLLSYRATTIARTESIRALNMSRHQLWNNLVIEGKVAEERIVRFWVSADDNRTRHAHMREGGIPDRNAQGVGLNQPFDSEFGPIMYPGDPSAPAENVVNCRCTVFTRIKG